MFKKISLFLIAIISVIALVGCFDLKEVDSIEFVNFPQATYYKVEEADVAKLNQAYETLLGEITIRINNQNPPITLKQAITDGTVTVNFDASILTKVGTKTMVITLGSAKLTYVFNVVEGKLFESGTGVYNDPYIIKTVEQFMNIGTRVFGVPVPTTNATEEAWKYYYQFSFPYLAGEKYYSIEADLDFTGLTFRPIGALGGINYIPFTGTIDGNNKSIKNLTINFVGDYCAIFAGIQNAEIKNLNLENINTGISYAKYTAALVAYSIPAKQTPRSTADQTSLYDNLVSKIDDVDVKNSHIAGHNRAGAIVAKMVATEVSNCDVDSNTKIIGFGVVGGLVAHPTSNNFYKYSDRSADGFTASDGKPAYVNLNDIKDCTFSGKVVADSGNNVGILFGYGSGTNNPNGFVGRTTYNTKADWETITPTIIDKNNTLNGRIETYDEDPDDDTVIKKFAVSTTGGDSSNRVFSLPNTVESVPNYNNKAATYVKIYDASGTPNAALAGETIGTNNVIIKSGVIYVNNKIELVNIDGEIVGSFYYPISSFDDFLTIYVKDNKIVGVKAVELN